MSTAQASSDTPSNAISSHGDRLDLSGLDWSTSDAQEASIDQLYRQVQTRVWSLIDWYYRGGRGNRGQAKGFRLFAVAFFSLGGLMPFVELAAPAATEATTADPDLWATILQQNWSDYGYLFIALAAVFLGFNRYLGRSSAWIRYVTTAMRLRELWESFQFIWAEVQARRGDRPPSPPPTVTADAASPTPPKPDAPVGAASPFHAIDLDDPEHLTAAGRIRLLRALMDAANRETARETHQWATAFTDDLNLLSQAIEQSRQSSNR
ncbi:MAG: SLATT domain-containing protein [Acidobacteriota bacterium]